MSEVNLSDKIAGILNSAPVNFDPEDDAVDATTAQVVRENIEEDNEEEEEILGKFRRDNVDLLADLDEKYAGKKISRKKLRDSDSEDDSLKDNTSDEDVSEESEDHTPSQSDESSEDSDDESGADEDEANWESIDDENFKHMSDTNISNQVKKGICVRNQMAMWESLLEVRIQLQKCLLTANKMPQNSTFKELRKESGQEFSNKVSETKNKLCDTLDKLLLLQNLLLKQFPETKKLTQLDETKSVKNDDEEIASDTDEEKSSLDDEVDAPLKKRRKLEDYEKDIDDKHKIYKEYRNRVIQKWNDKTRVVLKGGATSYSVLDQIEYNLSNRDRLLKRTQLKRSAYSILGEEEKNEDKNEEYNSEIFDDDDFYHQLLRELIEVKSADVTDPIQLGRQWIQLQNLRSKMKRKIDTRATKGRKIRYVVHNKLVNFMAPIDENLWTDEAKNELYNSLFGKN